MNKHSSTCTQFFFTVLNTFSLTMADADAARDTPKVQLPPFTPPKFHWNQDNLYKQFRSFKRVVEFAFKGQYEKCSNNVKCGSILNWLGIERIQSMVTSQ